MVVVREDVPPNERHHMRLLGHRLSTVWNGSRGSRAQTVGVCACGEWAFAGVTRDNVRDGYDEHLTLERELAEMAPAAVALGADFESEHIEGYARAAVERGQDGKFSAPLISEIMPGLWMGGCRDGVRLDDRFDHVVSLYPWGKYALADGTTRHEITMYDAGSMPNLDEVIEAAAEVSLARFEGQTVLVHCQAGLNRSGLITALSLIIDGWEPQDAIDLLRTQRSPVVLCNDTFERWLLTEARDAIKGIAS